MIGTVSYQEKLLFTKHLDTMVKSGIPITDALETLTKQSKNKKFTSVVESVLKSVENGQSLAKAFSVHPKVFDEFYISLVEVGEESGTLEDNLSFLAVQMAKDYSLRKKIRGALVYPGLIVTATFVMGAFIAFFILPKLTVFFESLEIELPVSTRILLAFANIMKNYGLLILICLIGFVLLVRFITRVPSVRIHWHTLLLRIPVLGPLYSSSQVARFARNLGTLIKSGTPVVRSLEITASTLSNLRFRKDLTILASSLKKGKKIGDTLEDNKFFEYPPMVAKMISVGEKTGKLDETLLYLGDFYEDEIDNASKNLSTIIEPILLVGIGLIVGFVALAIISPIYDLTGSL